MNPKEIENAFRDAASNAFTSINFRESEQQNAFLEVFDPKLKLKKFKFKVRRLFKETDLRIKELYEILEINKKDEKHFYHTLLLRKDKIITRIVDNQWNFRNKKYWGQKLQEINKKIFKERMKYD